MITSLIDFLHQPGCQLIISLVLSVWLTIESIPVIINISKLRNLMKIPEARSSHENQTPTLGGVAIFAGTMLGYFIWKHDSETLLHHHVIAATVILFFTGVKDDILVISPTKKMLAQIFASGLVVIGSDLRIGDFFGIFGIYSIPYVVSVGLTIFVFIALTNAINLIDGVDGLAGGIGLLASFVFGGWFYLNNQPSFAILAISLAGSLLGFLRFNFSKTSKIFMGDTGSLILGFILTVFAVKYIHLNTGSGSVRLDAPFLAIAVLVVPIFDTLRIFMVRMLQGRSPFSADKSHAHHILLAQGLSHLQVTLVSCVFTCVLIGLFLVQRTLITPTDGIFILLGFFLVYLGLIARLTKRVNYQDPSLRGFDTALTQKKQAKARLKKIRRLRKMYE